MFSVTNNSDSTSSIVSPKITRTPPSTPAGSPLRPLHKSRELSNLSELLNTLALDRHNTPQDTFVHQSMEEDSDTEAISPQSPPAKKARFSYPKAGMPEKPSSIGQKIMSALKSEVFTLENPGPTFSIDSSKPKPKLHIFRSKGKASDSASKLKDFKKSHPGQFN